LQWCWLQLHYYGMIVQISRVLSAAYPEYAHV
jgi:hypothetical protein